MRQSPWPLQFLVFQLAFEFLGLGHLAHRLAEVVLADGVAVIFDGAKAAVKS
jgi:hypothetical protein